MKDKAGFFVLHTQLPKPKTLGSGCLSIDKDGTAHFFSGDGGQDSKLLADMIRVRIDFAGGHGIMLSGMQPNGFDKTGKQKYFYQEWWLRYNDGTND